MATSESGVDTSEHNPAHTLAITHTGQNRLLLRIQTRTVRCTVVLWQETALLYITHTLSATARTNVRAIHSIRTVDDLNN